jgi:hypothetical protein
MNFPAAFRRITTPSVPCHLQAGDSLKVLRVVRDQGEVVVQGRGGNPHVILANEGPTGTELPRNLAGGPGDVTVKVQYGVMVEARKAVLLLRRGEAFAELTHADDADVKGRVGMLHEEAMGRGGAAAFDLPFVVNKECGVEEHRNSIPMRRTTDRVLLGLVQALQSILAQRRMAGPLPKILEQLAGEVGLAGKCGATHYRRKRFPGAPSRRFQFRNGVHFKLDGLGCHKAKLPEDQRLDKLADTKPGLERSRGQPIG